MHIGDVRDSIAAFPTNYVLVDTPGQIELFAFRQSSRYIVNELCGGRGLLLYMFEPHLSKDPSGLISQMLLPSVNILAKSDLLSREDLERITSLEDPDLLHDSVIEDTTLTGELNFEIMKAMTGMDAFSPLIPTSAREGEGIVDIYATVQNCFAGGEDLSPD